MQLVAASATALVRIQAMIDLRECTRRLIAYQLENRPEEHILREQEQLNAMYDRFAAKYGPYQQPGKQIGFSG